MADHDSTAGIPRARTYQKLATGIYADAHSIQAVVSSAAGRTTRRFPLDTDLRGIQRWRNETKSLLKARARPRRTVTTPLPFVPKHLEGWSYLYVIGSGASVKIGIARNPHLRLKELQTGHDWRLELLAATPAHVSLEKAVHHRFAPWRLEGEWFHFTQEIEQFVADLQAGKNPALWLW